MKRVSMRRVSIAAVAAVLASAGLATGAAAAEPRKGARSLDCRVVDGVRRCGESERRSARRETHDTVRANAVDPARNWGGVPDWARAAFGPNADSFPD